MSTVNVGLCARPTAREASGSIRKGADAEDLLLAGFLWRIDPGREGEARANDFLFSL